MSELPRIEMPDSWSSARLEDLGEWSGGGTPSKSIASFWKNGTVPWVSPKDMKSFEIHGTEDRITEEAVHSSAASHLPAGSILVVTRSGILRHSLPVAVTRVSVAVNQDIKALRPYPELVPDYVAYALRANAQLILHACVKDGTTVQSVEFGDLKQFRIPIAPAREQQRIADALDELLSDLDAGVEALQRAQEKLAHYRASVLKAAVQGELTAEWRKQHPQVEPASVLLQRILTERRQHWEQEQLRKFNATGKTPPANWKSKYKEPIAPDTTKLPELPEGWCWASLDQLGRLDRGRSKHRPRDAAFLYGGEYPFIQTGDVRRSRQYVRSHKQTYSEHGLRQSRLWPVNTLCITIAANIAETAILAYPACFPDSIVGVILNDDLVSTRFVELFFRSVRDRIAAYAPATAQKNINNEILRALAIPLPPSCEQQAIVDIAEEQISVIEHNQDEINQKRETARALRQSILRHAFTGQLVPQDTNDEPASELLKRIAEERAAGVTKKTGPRKPATRRQKRER